MKYEQPEFYFDTDEASKKESSPNQDPKTEVEKELVVDKPDIVDDGLDFYCDTCGDREGGCAQCGFGRNKNAA